MNIFYCNQNYLWNTILYIVFDFTVIIFSWRVIDIPFKVGGISHINATGNKVVIKTLEKQLWMPGCFPPKHLRYPNCFEIYLEILFNELNCYKVLYVNKLIEVTLKPLCSCNFMQKIRSIINPEKTKFFHIPRKTSFGFILDPVEPQKLKKKIF